MIVVTRPMPWAKPLCEKLQSADIQHVYLPAASLKKVDHLMPNQLDGIVLFLSQSGVLFAPDQLTFNAVFAVGPKTANAIRKKYRCDCHQPRPGHFSVAGLLEEPFFITMLKENPVLHIIGGTHSDISRFEHLDAKVHLYPVYTMVPTNEQGSDVSKHGEIWFTSQKLLELFFEHYILTLHQENLLSYDLVVPTMACQARASALGFKGNITVIADPRDESFIAHYQVKHRSK